MKAFKLEWKMHFDKDRKLEIIEYFVPYSSQVLDYFLPKNWKYVKECNSFENKYLEFMSIENVDNAWIDDGLRYYESDLSDYLSDFHTVYQSYMYGNNVESAEQLSINAKADYLVRKYIFFLKINLSILVQSDWGNQLENFELEDVIIKYIDFAIKLKNDLKNDEIYKKSLQQNNHEYLNLFRKWEHKKDLIILLLQIYKLINIYIDMYDSSDTRTNDIMFINIKKQLKQLPAILGLSYKRRYYYVNNFIKSLSFNQNDEFDNLKNSISYKKFQMLMENVFNEIIYEIEECTTFYRDESSKFEQLTCFFNLENDGRVLKKILNKFGKCDDSCFSIMRGKIKNYFSLSGVYEYELDTRKRNYEILAVAIYKVLEPEANISVNNVRLYKGNFIWAYFWGETKRWVEIKNDEIQLKKVVRLKEEEERDWKDTKRNGKAGAYACCERKILSHVENDNIQGNTIEAFFIRWTPCPKCQPALISEARNAKIYAYSKNFKEWKNDADKNTLKEYRIIQKIALEEV